MILLGHIVDVLNERVFDAQMVIEEGRIAAFSPVDNLPDNAPYILPGFVDGHIHIESTLMTPETFARVALSQGTVAVATDPHEIANVLGLAGVDYMVESASRTPLNFAFGIPSCVPSTPFETAGATITSDDVARLLPRSEFYGLAEMMNYPGVLMADPEVMRKIRLTLDAGKLVDGHAPGVTGDDAQRYISAGITTDHEVFDIAHARERIALGMKIQIREGAAACNFNELAPLLADDANKHMLMFCTDDIYPNDLLQGHINRLVALAVQAGYPLWNVLHAACVTPVHHYRLPVGLLQLGDSADFVMVDNLADFNVLSTYIGGRCVYDKSSTPSSTSPIDDALLPNNFHAHAITPEDLRIEAPKDGEKVRVIVAEEGSLYTRQMQVDPKVAEGLCVSDVERDILKVVVLNRYSQTPCTLGFIHGFGLKRGAIASTIAHDSHNIIALGVDDDSLASAINELIAMRGGICATDAFDTVANDDCSSLPLPIAGLMSPLAAEEIARRYLATKQMASALGCPFAAPFMTLAFMALPVIPEIKITDKFLFDVMKFAPTTLLV